MLISGVRHKTLTAICLLTCIIICSGHAKATETEVSDTIMHHLDDFVVSATYKGTETELLHPISNTHLNMPSLISKGIEDIQSLSGIVPNLHIPDYGSNMTSSIYLRGLGSRIDHPVISLYVDDIPVMNKNAYDFDLLDISNITIIRGPQNTLYGRSSMGGTISISTMESDQQYTRAKISYGSGNTVKGFVTHNFQHNVQLNVRGSYTDGLFTNKYNNTKCDKGYSAAATIKYKSSDTLPVHIKSLTDASWLSQNGYPYQQVDEQGKSHNISYNDPCRYQRLTARQGIILEWTTNNVHFNSTTSYNYINDKMTMDQDFTSKSMFTLVQSQREHTLNEDFMIHGSVGIWKWLAGVNIYFKSQRLQGDVVFKRDGIDELILKNANAGLQQASSDVSLQIEDPILPILSKFRQNEIAISAYHNSILSAGQHWKFNLGIRVEHEQQFFNYDSHATMRYSVLIKNAPTSSATLTTNLAGNEHQALTEVTPNVSVTFSKQGFRWTASASRGCKSGGFNTQLFSDLLQQQLTFDWLGKLGFIGNKPDVGSVVSYKPEYIMSYETGFGYSGEKGFSCKLIAYYIDCRDQQLTVFPSGTQTGRMMTNAGKTRSFGAETEISYNKVFEAKRTKQSVSMNASYGYSNAKFVKYNNGRQNLAGNYLPYAPQHTVSLDADYSIGFNLKTLDRIGFHIGWLANGPIFWDDENRYKQNFYGLLQASISAGFKDASQHYYTIKIFGKNLTKQEYNTFYFVSVGNHFLQKGKPLEYGVQFTFSL